MKNRPSLWIIMGLLLIAAALSLTAYNFYDQSRAQRSVAQVMEQMEALVSPAVSSEPISAPEAPEVPVQLVESEEPETETPEAPAEEPVIEDEIEIPDYILNPDMDMPVTVIDDVDYIGVLRIPVLEMELPIISQWSYPLLKIAPCRYQGSAYKEDMIIAGHSYPAHFGALEELIVGDTVTFTDVDGNVFWYQVVEMEILASNAGEELESGDWELTLFTCTVSGQSRVTIRCESMNK